MDWDDLRLFLAVARQGTIVDAARALECDHSTVSRRLSQLEATIGVELFHRAGRRLRITDAGSKLRRTAEKVETTLIKDMADIDEARAIRTGSVTIGAPEGLGVGYLAVHVGAIVGLYPEISIELIALPRNFSLADREVDIAITLDRPSAGDLTFRKLTDYTLQFYGSPAYLERSGTPRTAHDLQAHRLCGYIDQLLHTAELNYMRSLGKNLRPQIKSSSIAAQMQTIASGAAIGILPRFMAFSHPGLRPILPDTILTRSYWMSFHNDLRRVERVRLVFTAIADMAQQHQHIFR